MINLLTSIFLLTFALLLSGCQPNPSSSKVSEPCKNLGKVNTIDDWLYQVHSNINSQCLFEMPVSELERIWGLPIIDDTKVNWGMMNNLQANQMIQFHKMKRSQARTFYVIKDVQADNKKLVYFEMVIDSQYRKQQYHTFGGSMLAGVFPYHLPRFDFYQNWSSRTNFTLDPSIDYENHPFIRKEISPYTKFSHYYWVNANRKRNMPSLEMRTGYIPTVTRIVFKNHTEDLIWYEYYAALMKFEQWLKKR